ncbi:MAG: hypothetical protein LBG52_08700 [Candidatus Peribacteria bacterium]|jgi:hypothetical protein|nr:hypothetical protein [Candidatus Peribacteria bacterium]
MSGGIAEAFYTGVPKDFVEKAISYLRQDSQGEDLIKVVEQFREKYGCP